MKIRIAKINSHEDEFSRKLVLARISTFKVNSNFLPCRALPPQVSLGSICRSEDGLPSKIFSTYTFENFYFKSPFSAWLVVTRIVNSPDSTLTLQHINRSTTSQSAKSHKSSNIQLNLRSKIFLFLTFFLQIEPSLLTDEDRLELSRYK